MAVKQTVGATAYAEHQTRALIAWLLEGDPAIRWQVLADLNHASQSQIEEQRSQVAVQGWGADLLRRQDDDGLWAGAVYSPKWTSATYTLLLLERLGLQAGHPQAIAGCAALWEHARVYDGGITFAKTIREPETCITGMLVFLSSAFGFADPRLDQTVEWILDQQLADGGWNCESIRSGSTHGSFHTSITVLEALSAYEKSGGSIPVATQIVRGRRFFLDHRLYRSHRTGQVANSAFTHFPFPPQWHFDIMRGLEHFRDAGAEPDPRLRDAIGVLQRTRRSDGTWPLYRSYPGRYWFKMEQRGPSRWSTLRALRILNWWDTNRYTDLDQDPG